MHRLSNALSKDAPQIQVIQELETRASLGSHSEGPI